MSNTQCRKPLEFRSPSEGFQRKHKRGHKVSVCGGQPLICGQADDGRYRDMGTIGYTSDMFNFKLV